MNETAWIAIAGAVAATALTGLGAIVQFFAFNYLREAKRDSRLAREEAADLRTKIAETKTEIAREYATKEDLQIVDGEVGCKVDKSDFAIFATGVERKLDDHGRDIKEILSRLPAPTKEKP